MSNKNVLYVEPNYVNSIQEEVVVNDNGNLLTTNQVKVYDIAPSLEDYCVVVDLQVEIKARQSSKYVTDSKTYCFTWTTKPKDGKNAASFYEGKKIKFGTSSQVNYLTTDPNEIGTYKDAIENGTNECFGINSIDIMYNNYMVPEVDIEFTDIRGISLFAPEELRHSASNKEGINGNIRDDVAGSFFKCFFTFPYPVFKLIVKGFYGEPVSYELCCADFRANFDCNTGNFGARAKFVGYSYSLLNDVTLNALVVSPYSDYIGKEYWANKNFTFDDGTKMISIIDVLSKIKGLKDSLKKLDQTDPLSEKSRSLDDIGKNIANVSNCYANYFNKATNTINDYFDNKEKNKSFKINSNLMSFALYSESNKSDIILDCKKEYDNLVSAINQSYGEINFPAPQKIEIKLQEINDLVPTLKKNNLYIDDIDTKKYVYYYNGSALNSFINKHKNENANQVKENEKEIATKKDNIIEQSLGFKPTVQNITKMLLAHLETFMHCVYYCCNVINNKERKKSDIGLLSTDIRATNDIVTPFPRVDITRTENNISVKEEGWMGDLDEGSDEEEVYLIEGLLKGANDFSSVVTEASKALVDDTSNSLPIQIPLTILDMVLTKSPFGDSVNFNNISDFIGILGLRMCSLFGMNNIYTDYIAMGKADALNFANSVKNKPSKRFLDRLYGGTITPTFIFDCLYDKDNVKNEKINNLWAWDDYNNTESTPFLTYAHSNIYSLNRRADNSDDLVFLPIQVTDWDRIRNEISSKEMNKLTEDYLCTSQVENKPNKFIFDIDLDYMSYINFKNLMEIESTPFRYVSELNLEFNSEDYLEDYFDNYSNQFSKKFKANTEEIATFRCVKDSWLLPKEKPYYSDASKSEAFENGSGYDVEFEKINNAVIDNDIISELERDTSSFDDAVEEMNSGNISSFTIPTFGGIIDGEYDNNVSIFGQREYYEQNNYVRALLFLFTFKVEENMFNDDGCIEIEDIEDSLLDQNKPFDILPYLGILLIGGVLWRKEQENEPVKFGRDITSKIFSVFNSTISILRKEVKARLINEFTSWVDNDNGFKEYQRYFELHPLNHNSSINLIDEMDNFFDGNKRYSTFVKNASRVNPKYNNFESYLCLNLDENFYDTYISISKQTHGYKLYNRETSSMIKSMTNLLVKPCAIIKPTRFIYDNTSNSSLSRRYPKDISFSPNAMAYLNSFLEKLKEIYKDLKDNGSKSVSVTPANSDINIKRALYKYIKILWDKWLSGTDESEWSLEKFYKDNWYFIDGFYNKIGDSICINILNFCSDVVYSQSENGYSLLSFLGKVYAKDRFAFHCVQNFMDMTDGQDAFIKMNNMFKPIPYKDIRFENIDKHPSFIVMYTSEYSSKLDIKDSDFETDSFDISSDDDLPIPITNKTDLTGYKIPAFGVSYGRQYQSYFKNIDVNMDNPIVTEQAIKAQFMIASMNGKQVEDNKNIITLGQDLYTIYSNNSYTCTVTMMGCAWVQPLMYFQLLNVPMFRGAYLIQKVTHKISPGNMETTFVGVRMPKVTTSKINKGFYIKQNDETNPKEIEDIMGSNADVTNDCNYKFFSPLIDKNNPCMSEDVLNMTLAEYEEYIGSKFNEKVTEKTELVKDLLSGVVELEAGNQGKLGKQLVATVLFNRYMHHGKNLTKLFYDKQHEVGYNPINADLVSEIFTQSPSILVGETTSVDKQVPIWEKGEKLGTMTTPKTITEHDVKSIDGYCTTNGYYALDKNKKGDGKTEPFGWWQDKASYCLHHKGHVFVSGAFTYNKEHWQETDMSNKTETNDSYHLAKRLFDSIKKSIETSKILKVDSIEMELDKNQDESFFITASPSKILVNVFDAAMNTYYNYVKEVNWVFNNDGSEIPSKVRIVASKNKEEEKTFAVSKMDNNGVITNINKYEGLNEFFYMALKKHYRKIDSSNRDKFSIECKNFSSLIANETLWDDKVNNLFGYKEIIPCGAYINSSSATGGYTWNGDDTPSNTKVIAKKIDSYNANNAATYADNNKLAESNGRCAEFVRNAMQQGGGANFTYWPGSACAYSKYLPLWGFTEVYSGFSPITEGYTPQKGDISVIAGLVNNVPKRIHGHIQIYDGTGWVSDFKARTAYCYGDSGRPFKIFRWLNG